MVGEGAEQGAGGGGGGRGRIWACVVYVVLTMPKTVNKTGTNVSGDSVSIACEAPSVIDRLPTRITDGWWGWIGVGVWFRFLRVSYW